MAGTRKSPASPATFGADNYRVEETDTTVTITFAKGVNLHPTASEVKRLAEGKPGLGTYTVSASPAGGIHLADGTQVTWNAYNSPKLAANANKPAEPTAADLLSALQASNPELAKAVAAAFAAK